MNTGTHNHIVIRMALCSLMAIGAVTGGTADAQQGRYLEIDPAKFDRSTNIDNEWWPLKPGIRMTYEGSTIEDGKKISHRFVDTVTDLTKMINGIRALVSLEIDYKDNKLLEKEIAFHAQDKEGNVWHLGQLREMYDHPDLIGGQAWLVGHPEGAKAGIRMLAKPTSGGQEYSQGYAPAPYNWTDRARVAKMGQSTKVRAGAYKDVMLIEEWDAESPKGAVQTKYFARGIGVVRIGFKGRDKTKEELELVKIEQLGPEALAEARAEAFALEKRANEYSSLPPLERLVPSGGDKK